MATNRFVFLTNPQANNDGFKRQRSYTPPTEDDTNEEAKFISENQKNEPRRNNATFITKRKARNDARTISFPSYIDLVKISFFTIFKGNLPALFNERYGLNYIEFSDFNRTVTFEILDQERFRYFLQDIKAVITSSRGTSYEGQSFNLIALIQRFEFIDAQARTSTRMEEAVLLKMISSSNNIYTIQKRTLLDFLQSRQIAFNYNDNTPDLIELQFLDRETRTIIADNFDIVRAITSSRSARVNPGIYNEARIGHGFTITIPEYLTVVGVIDTGAVPVAPLQTVFTNIKYDHTSGNNAHWDESGHGTGVAGLVVLGEEFCRNVSNSYEAKARIATIKALHQENDPISISSIVRDIRHAKRQHGIRIFNMSLNLPLHKSYNSSYSHFAYELDRVAHEEDVLIFISVGNMDPSYLEEALITEKHPDHDYPIFFYNPNNNNSPFHGCDLTNLLEPAESLNNVSVGALAGNLEDEGRADISPGKEYPAYYTRKSHYDFDQNINGIEFKRNQKNKNLVKPDLIFEGGDLFNETAGMDILSSPLAENGNFFAKSSGTSLAAPLVTSYAAQVLNKYPELRTQTVKALLINSASFYKKNQIPAFNNHPESLLKRLIGFGRPDINRLLATEDNSVLFVIESTIQVGELLMLPINLPEYLRTTNNKLRFEISLCYSFQPVKDNHLNYLPLHISFKLTRDVNISLAANSNSDASEIKKGMSWSEDHFGLESRLFANAQSVAFNLQPADLIALGDESVALAVRCLLKESIPDPERQRALHIAHQFSVVVRITELQTATQSNKLYQEMLVCNLIENIAEATGDATLDIK